VESRKQQIPFMTMYLRMSEIKFEMENTEDEEEHLESAKEFYELLIPYLNSMETIVNQLREAKNKIESIL
jgi:hypothetical protein